MKMWKRIEVILWASIPVTYIFVSLFLFRTVAINDVIALAIFSFLRFLAWDVEDIAEDVRLIKLRTIKRDRY